MKELKIRNFRSWTCILIALGVCVLSISCSSDGNKEESNTSTSTNTTANAPASEDAPEHGVGPVEEVNLEAEINPVLAESGKVIYDAKCSACHKFDQRYVGPALAEVTERRNPAWIMNMIINPQEMTQKDPVAKKLLAEYMTQMVAQDVDQDDARALLEYFRQVDSEN